MTLLVPFGWVLTSCLFLWLLAKRDQAQRAELVAAQAETTALAKSHAEQLERIFTAQREEVAVLLQRIQAPEVAVAMHASEAAPPDPPPLDLEDDIQLIEAHEREMERFQREIEGLA